MPKDRYGSLRRTPKEPTNGSYPTLLRRSYQAYDNRARSVAQAERAVLSARTDLAKATDASRRDCERRLATAEARLARSREQRALTLARMDMILRGIATRTRAYQHHTRDFSLPAVERLARRAQDVVDAADVRAAGSEASSALNRLDARHGPSLRHLIARYGQHLSEDDARARIREGLWHGCHQWDWAHPSGASLTTRAYPWAIRVIERRLNGEYSETELLRRAEEKRALKAGASKEQAKAEAKRRSVASLDALRAGSTGDGCYEPVMSRSRRGVASASTAMADAETQRQIDSMRHALEALSEQDRMILSRVGMGEPAKRVAKDYAMPLTTVMRRYKDAAAQVRREMGE